MIYNSSESWVLSKNKVITFFGMSGVGKSHISSILCEESDWFHYSVDYRIGTVYLSEKIREILNPKNLIETEKKINFLENPLNIKENDYIEKKSKRDLILLFFKKEFFIILL